MTCKLIIVQLEKKMYVIFVRTINRTINIKKTMSKFIKPVFIALFSFIGF